MLNNKYDCTEDGGKETLTRKTTYRDVHSSRNEEHKYDPQCWDMRRFFQPVSWSNALNRKIFCLFCCESCRHLQNGCCGLAPSQPQSHMYVKAHGHSATPEELDKRHFTLCECFSFLFRFSPSRLFLYAIYYFLIYFKSLNSLCFPFIVSVTGRPPVLQLLVVYLCNLLCI